MSKGKTAPGANRGLLILLLLVTLGGVGGLAAYVQMAPAQFLSDAEKKPERRAASEQSSGRVPVPSVDSRSGIQFGSDSTSIPAGADPRLHVINEFLQRFGESIQAEAVRMDGPVAMIHFPEGTALSLGSQDEATLLLGLRSSLGQFPEIEAVELYLAGQKVDELGHMDLSQPLPVIRPENWKRPTSPSGTQGPSARG